MNIAVSQLILLVKPEVQLRNWKFGKNSPLEKEKTGVLSCPTDLSVHPVVFLFAIKRYSECYPNL